MVGRLLHLLRQARGRSHGHSWRGLRLLLAPQADNTTVPNNKTTRNRENRLNINVGYRKGHPSACAILPCRNRQYGALPASQSARQCQLGWFVHPAEKGIPMETQATRPVNRPVQQLTAAQRISAVIDDFVKHWLLIANAVLGIFVITPWLAPVFMHAGWEGAGRAIYFVYGFFCHQLPERSWFLFGHISRCRSAEIQQHRQPGRRHVRAAPLHRQR